MRSTEAPYVVDGVTIPFTFKEFCRNPDKYRYHETLNFDIVDGAGTMLKGIMNKKVKFELEGYKCDTLEEVERTANRMGIPLKNLDYKPTLIPTGGGKADVLVRWVPKHERIKREAW